MCKNLETFSNGKSLPAGSNGPLVLLSGTWRLPAPWIFPSNPNLQRCRDELATETQTHRHMGQVVTSLYLHTKVLMMLDAEWKCHNRIQKFTHWQTRMIHIWSSHVYIMWTGRLTWRLHISATIIIMTCICSTSFHMLRYKSKLLQIHPKTLWSWSYMNPVYKNNSPSANYKCKLE